MIHAQLIRSDVAESDKVCKFYLTKLQSLCLFLESPYRGLYRKKVCFGHQLCNFVSEREGKRLSPPTQKREKHALLTLLLSFGASACSTSTVTRTRSVARDLSRLVERRLNLEARADHRNGQTRKFSYLVRVYNTFVLRDLRRAIA
jgi:hypothetical protein